MNSLLTIDEATFAASFGREPCAVHHDLTGHPLLALGAIAQLADSLPAHQVEHNLGNVATVLPGGAAPQSDLSPGEIARGIETNGCWMVLKNIETAAPYARLLHDSLDEVAAHVPSREGEMGEREGFLFLSAPGSVTPSHFDPEHNLLLEIRGTKTMNVGRFPDPATEHEELGRYYGGGHRNVAWMPDDARAFTLGAGDGVYVPVHAPHWVTVADNVAMSLSITFRTTASAEAMTLHQFNAQLRRLRLTPRPVGEREWADRAKLRLIRTARRLRPKRKQ